jgi:hypothetical protein
VGDSLGDLGVFWEEESTLKCHRNLGGNKLLVGVDIFNAQHVGELEELWLGFLGYRTRD